MNQHSPIGHPKNKTPAQTIVTRRHPEAGFVIAWTDGSTFPNPGPGGWGFRIEPPGGEPIERHGGVRSTTNNRMELFAIINAVAESPRELGVIVRTDSQLCVLCATGSWRRKNNIELWARLDSLCRGRIVLYEWWRGHAGTPGNERADQLALSGRLANS
jgi:ribonuclease HI